MFGSKPPAVVFVPVGARSSDTHHHTTVNQQPNDAADAARLYGECMEKARAEITSVMLREIPAIDVKLITFQMARATYDLTDRMLVAFKINGREVKTLVEMHMDRDLFKAGIKP